MQKIKVAVIFGGTNTEHEVSIVSATSVINHLDPSKYTVLPIYITKQNQWTQMPVSEAALLPSTIDKEIAPTDFIQDKIDVIFPIMHGPFGEDGTIQGMLEMLHLPYVGCGVLASAMCMDKVIQKQLCQAMEIPIVPFASFTKHEWQQNPDQVMHQIRDSLHYPLFVKPVNQGSSVGVTKIHAEAELKSGMDQAFVYDVKIIVEQGVDAVREIECAILGNEHPEASVLGEINPSNEFYDYDAKYIDGQSESIIPADLPPEITSQVQTLAKKAFKILNCSGLARVDFLVNRHTNEIYLNELNTMPGFTSISMYPKLWQASGLSYENLIEKLITLALERFSYQSSRTLSITPKTNWINPDHT